MITVDELKKEIESNLIESEIRDDRGKKLLGRKNKELRETIMFLETNPNESFIRLEADRIDSIIKSKSKGYEYWTKNICDKSVDIKKRKSMFNSQLGITQLKKQLKKLKYILKK